MANSFSDILKEAKALFSKEKVLESVIDDAGTKQPA